MTGISYVDMDFGDAVETSLEHLARLGHTCVALFNFPADLLEAGYTSALIARDVFERRAAEFGIRAIHLPCSHAPKEAFAVAARFAEMLTPSLTGVEWPAFEAGRMAAEMLIEQLTLQHAPPRQHLIGAELVVRESTGPRRE